MGIRNRDPGATARARELRRGMSKSERKLWTLLRGERIGFRVRRQYPVGPYILDFFVHEAKLCIEVDGELHRLREQQDTDRDKRLAELGILTLRVPTGDLFDDVQAVGRTIQRLCCERAGRSAWPKPF